jgi:hypothetical protein
VSRSLSLAPSLTPRRALLGCGAVALWAMLVGLTLEQRARAVEKQANVTRLAAERLAALAGEDHAAGELRQLPRMESALAETERAVALLRRRVDELGVAER